MSVMIDLPFPECRTQDFQIFGIKKDLIDIWSKTTIQNNIPNEFKDEAKQVAKEKADQKRKNVIEECVTVSSQMVSERSSI